jgi:hypothetical protein
MGVQIPLSSLSIVLVELAYTLAEEAEKRKAALTTPGSSPGRNRIYQSREAVSQRAHAPLTSVRIRPLALITRSPQHQNFWCWGCFISRGKMSQSIDGRFSYLKPGDKVIRLMGGKVPLDMYVVKIEDGLIHANDVRSPIADDEPLWKFDIRNGAEIDEHMGWTSEKTGSMLLDQDGFNDDVDCYSIEEVTRQKFMALMLAD